MNSEQLSVRERLMGAWRYLGTTVNGERRDRGVNPKGLLYYGPHGEMSVQIAPDVHRARGGDVMTPAEAVNALTKYVAYFGNYSIDETAGTITHHRFDSVQPGDHEDLVRRYVFQGNRLVLNPPGTNMEVVWERVE